MKKIIFSGIQPSGIIHLGNYFGAIHNWLKLQNNYECLFSIVDLHALTVYQKPEELAQNIKTLAKLYLSCGLDPEKNIIFRQSDVKEHAELAWILNCVTPMSELERMTQFKDKSKQHKENINAGLFTYPCLMAADILLYDTNTVPVGEDQTQHVELTRTIAKKFNAKFGETFFVPEVMVNKATARIMGLDDPTKKMSKSAANQNNYISLTDTPDNIRQKIKKAVTDSGSEIIYSVKKPALANLLSIYQAVTGQEFKDIEKQFSGQGYGDFKNALAEEIVQFLSPIQKKFNSISDKELENVLQKGADKATKLAEAKMKVVKKKLGL